MIGGAMVGSLRQADDGTIYAVMGRYRRLPPLDAEYELMVVGSRRDPRPVRKTVMKAASIVERWPSLEAIDHV